MVGTTDVTMDVAFTVDWRLPSIDVGEMAISVTRSKDTSGNERLRRMLFGAFPTSVRSTTTVRATPAAQRGIMSSNRMPRRAKRP